MPVSRFISHEMAARPNSWFPDLHRVPVCRIVQMLPKQILAPLLFDASMDDHPNGETRFERSDNMRVQPEQRVIVEAFLILNVDR